MTRYVPAFSNQKTVTTLIDSVTITASGNSVSNTLDMRNALRLALSIACTYDGAATDGVTVYIYTNEVDENWSTGTDASELTSFQPKGPGAITGNDTYKPVYIDPDANFMRIKVLNDDAAKTVSGVTVKATVTT